MSAIFCGRANCGWGLNAARMPVQLAGAGFFESASLSAHKNACPRFSVDGFANRLLRPLRQVSALSIAAGGLRLWAPALTCHFTYIGGSRRMDRFSSYRRLHEIFKTRSIIGVTRVLGFEKPRLTSKGQPHAAARALAAQPRPATPGRAASRCTRRPESRS